MNTLGIIAVKIGKENNLKIKTGEAIPVIFTFTRPLEKGETVNVKCHVDEEKFDLNYTLGIFTLSMEHQEVCSMVILGDDPSSCESKPIDIMIPEELAGTAVNLIFSIQREPCASSFTTDLSFLLYKRVTVDIISSEGGPKIEAIYWSNSKDIKFGKLSAPRTDALIKNELVYLHIHTRGLYGKQVTVQCNDTSVAFPRTVMMRNNVAVEAYTFFDDRISEIETYCVPFLPDVVIKLTACKRITIPYIKDEEVVLSTKTMQVFACPHTPKKKDYASEAKCRVDFRPKKDYDGSFGFSWYRVGDMNTDTGYSEYISTHGRTKQRFKVNEPCNDHPFSEKDFPGEGILGRHYETVSNWIFWKKDRIVENGNDSGTGSGVNYPKSGTRDNFIADATMADDHKKDYPKISLFGYTDAEPIKKEYLAPVMTLIDGKTVELQFFLHIKKTPKEILFVFDNPCVEIDGVLTINIKPADIVSPAVTSGPTPSVTHTIEITCNKKFDKEIRLKAYAIPDSAKDGMVKKENGRLVLYPQEGSPLVIPELCGMMRILPNDDAHWRKINVVFFNVKTNLDKKKKPIGGLVVPTIEVGPFTLEPPVPMRPPEPSPVPLLTFPFPAPTGDILPFTFSTFLPLPPPKPMVIKCATKEERVLNKFLAQAYVKANIIVEDINLDGNSTYEKMCIDTDGNGIKDRYDYPNYSSGLRGLLTDDPLSVEYDAKDYYRLYFMPDKAVRVGGFSVPGKNFTICFPGMGESIPAHELGHTLGLPHTFNGNTNDGAKYTYEDGKTDNIMDYAHFVGIDAQSFFHWQWEILNTNLNK